MQESAIRDRLTVIILFLGALAFLNIGMYAGLPVHSPRPVDYSGDLYAIRVSDQDRLDAGGWTSSTVTADGTPVHWTMAPTAIIEQPMFIKSDLKLQFQVAAAMPGMLDSLSVTVKGVEVQLTRTPSGQGTLFVGRVLRQILGDGKQVVSLVFHTAEPPIPVTVDSSSTDIERKGIALQWLRLEPITNAALINFDGTEQAKGWLSPEQLPDGTPFQWMGLPNTSVHLPPQPPGDLALTFNVLLSVTPETLDNLTLTVNNQPISLYPVPSTKYPGTVLEAVIPHTVLGTGGSGVWLDFHIPQTSSPQQLGKGSDSRQLGVALDWLSVYPIQYAWLSMDILRWGDGWEGIEINSFNDLYRWMSKTPARFDLMLPDTPTLVQFDAVYSMSDDIAKSMTLTVDGQPIPLTSEHLVEGWTFHGTLPPSRTCRPTRLIFAVNKLVSARQQGNGLDTQQLGVALKWLSLAPAQ